MKVDNVPHFQAVFEVLPSPLMVMNTDLEIIAMNQAYLDVTGRSRESLIGRNIFAALPIGEESRRLVQDSLERARNEGSVDVLPLLAYAIPRGGVMEPRYWTCTHVPIRGEDGKVAFILQTPQDISELKGLRDLTAKDVCTGDAGGEVLQRAETMQSLNESLLAETHHLRRLFMQAPSFMCVLRGPNHVCELANLAFLKLTGGRELIGKPIREAMPELAETEYLDLLDHVFKTGEAFVGRKMRVLLQSEPNGGLKEYFLDFVYQPIMGVKGEINGIFVDGSDVTDHVRAEERQALLIRELHHRVRNTLATVQGVMNTTAKSSATIEDFQQAFAGRIASLAKTHSIMTEELQQSVSFVHLLNQELGPYSDDRGRRIRLDGPPVDLPSQIAVPLGMAIHELTTNAAKHGSLSKEEGRVEVSWSVVDKAGVRALLCEWHEFDGPAVVEPSSHGFGSMLLNRVLSQQIGASVNAEYDPAGFRLRMTVPLQIEG